MDFQKLLDMMTEMFGKFKSELPKAYENPYATEQQKLYSMLTDKINNPAQFDPNNDAALKVAQDQARLKVIGDMAKRGRVFDTYADTQTQQAQQ